MAAARNSIRQRLRGWAGIGSGANLGVTEADVLFDGNKKFKVVPIPGRPVPGGGADVPRQADGRQSSPNAQQRNLNISQLTAPFALSQQGAAALPAGLS